MIDWLIWNANFISISTISWRKLIVYIKYQQDSYIMQFGFHINITFELLYLNI